MPVEKIDVYLELERIISFFKIPIRLVGNVYYNGVIW